MRLSGLCGADRCGFSLQAGAPRRVLCHTLQSGEGRLVHRGGIFKVGGRRDLTWAPNKLSVYPLGSLSVL